MKKLHSNVYLGVFFALFSAFMLYQTKFIAIENEESAVFPRLILIAMMLVSIYIAITGFFSSEKIEWKIQKNDLKRVCLLLLTMLVYIVIYKFVGYVVATIFLVAGALLCFLNKNKLTVVLVSLIAPISVYLVFTRLLGVRLR